MNRNQRRLVASIERKGMASGEWPPWRKETFARGSVGTSSWLMDITESHSNTVYAVLVRYLDLKRFDPKSGRIHLAIRTGSNLEPPWRDLQRIKNELFGQDRFAVQVCPPQDRLIDDADMYHLFIMEKGHTPGFGLHPEDEPCI